MLLKTSFALLGPIRNVLQGKRFLLQNKRIYIQTYQLAKKKQLDYRVNRHRQTWLSFNGDLNGNKS